ADVQPRAGARAPSPHWRLHAVHDRYFSRPRRPAGHHRLLRTRGAARLSLRVRDGPRRWEAGGAAVPAPVRPFRAVRGRADLRPQSVLQRRRLGTRRLAGRPVPPPAAQRMTAPGARDDEAACLNALERALRDGAGPDLADCTRTVLDAALREIVRRHGSAAALLIR